MLKRLHISNYALIEFLDISFESGLLSITGETGAGKSIILGALSLLLGKRCDTSVLKNKEIKSIVEIELLLENSNFSTVFLNHEIDFDTNTIIRREISPQGKSRAFINDTPVSLQTLKEIGELLIDIHSQHQNLFLKESVFQCQVVDAAANNVELLQKFEIEYSELQSIKKELHDFVSLISKNKEEIAFQTFRLQELKNAKLQINEFEELEQELSVLEHGEEIKSLFSEAQDLFENDNSLLSSLKTVLHGFQKKSSLSKEFEELAERLSQSYIEIADIAQEISKYNANLDFDPNRLDTIHQRIDIINGLLHKFSCNTVSELIDEQKRLEQLISHVENADFNSLELQKKYDAKKSQILSIALEIRKKRMQAIKILEPQLISMLQKLGMPSVSFTIELQELEDYQQNGMDSILMLFSANKNIPLQWLGEVSSGGELSRVMLCLKAILAKNKSLETIIFDEIDTGVSGEIADQMGNMMIEMAKDMQVIVITHLPQIAAKAKKQFKVFKEETSETTTSNIIELNENQRIEELAKMMSGKTVTEAAMLNAKHLLGIK